MVAIASRSAAGLTYHCTSQADMSLHVRAVTLGDLMISSRCCVVPLKGARAAGVHRVATPIRSRCSRADGCSITPLGRTASPHEARLHGGNTNEMDLWKRSTPHVAKQLPTETDSETKHNSAYPVASNVARLLICRGSEPVGEPQCTHKRKAAIKSA